MGGSLRWKLSNYVCPLNHVNIEVGGQSICGGQSNWQSFAHYGNTASVPGRPDQRPGSRGGFMVVGVL